MALEAHPDMCSNITVSALYISTLLKHSKRSSFLLAEKAFALLYRFEMQALCCGVDYSSSAVEVEFEADSGPKKERFSCLCDQQP